ARVAVLPVDHDGTAGAGVRAGNAGAGRGQPRVLGDATPGLPGERLGEPAVVGHRHARRTGVRGGRGGAEVPGRGAVAGFLGRLPRGARDDRVLAGRAGTAARPAPVPARERRLGRGAAGPVTTAAPGQSPTWQRQNGWPAGSAYTRQSRSRSPRSSSLAPRPWTCRSAVSRSSTPTSMWSCCGRCGSGHAGGW